MNGLTRGWVATLGSFQPSGRAPGTPISSHRAARCPCWRTTSGGPGLVRVPSSCWRWPACPRAPGSPASRPGPLGIRAASISNGRPPCARTGYPPLIRVVCMARLPSTRPPVHAGDGVHPVPVAQVVEVLQGLLAGGRSKATFFPRGPGRSSPPEGAGEARSAGRTRGLRLQPPLRRAPLRGLPRGQLPRRLRQLVVGASPRWGAHAGLLEELSCRTGPCSWGASGCAARELAVHHLGRVDRPREVLLEVVLVLGHQRIELQEVARPASSNSVPMPVLVQMTSPRSPAARRATSFS